MKFSYLYELHNEEPYNVRSSSNIVSLIKPRKYERAEMRKRFHTQRLRRIYEVRGDDPTKRRRKLHNLQFTIYVLRLILRETVKQRS